MALRKRQRLLESRLRVTQVALQIGDVATQMLKVTPGAVYKWIREGKLRAVKFGDRTVRIPQSSIEAFERQAREHYEQAEHRPTPALAG